MTRAPQHSLFLVVGIVSFSFAGTSAYAAGEKRDAVEHTIVVGVGGAVEYELREGSLHPGGNLFVEWEAIEDWLEIELGASLLAADGGVEIPIDLLFKKPFRLARWAEIMVGLGPEVVIVSTPSTKSTFAGAEFALDFMFWPSRHVGLWVEPTYDVIFRTPASSAIGSTGGLIFGW